MRPPPVVVRRAVVDPLWLPVALVLAAALLVVAALAALPWLVTRRGRPLRLALLAALYLILNAGLLLACTVLWLRHPAAARRDEEQWTAAHFRLLRQMLTVLRSAAGPLLGLAVAVEEPPDGGRLLSHHPVLVLARHAGPGDSFTLVELLLSRYGRRPRIVLKEILQWDPGLDVVLNRLRACFLPAVAGAGADLPARLAELAASLRGDDAMLIFPEGRNWTPTRYRRAIARLRRRASRQAAADAHRQAAADAAMNLHVLPPRPAGVLACLAARPDLDVVVVAHTGLDDLVSPAQVWDALPLAGRPMTIRWWHEPAAAVPADPGAQYQWLRVQWALVDSWIGARKARSEVAADPGYRRDLVGPAVAGPPDLGEQDAAAVLEPPG